MEDSQSLAGDYRTWQVTKYYCLDVQLDESVIAPTNSILDSSFFLIMQANLIMEESIVYTLLT